MLNIVETLLKISYLLVFSLFLSLAGCDYANSPEVTETVSKIGEKIESGSSKIKNHASEEIQKLQTIEYKVFSLPNDITTEDLEKNLSELGKERWDCALSNNHETTVIRFICKRLPSTYLRLLPYAF